MPKADRLLIDELKKHEPSPKRLFKALRLGAQWERSLDCDGARRPVHCLALHCRDPALFELCRRMGADFSSPDALGDLFIHWAVAERNLEGALWWLEAFGRAPLSGEGLSLAELALAVGAPDSLTELIERAPKAFPPSDFQRAFERLDLISASRHALFPEACASGALSLLEANPALASPSRSLSGACARLAGPGPARLARAFEDAAIAKAEREALGEALPSAPSASSRFI